MSRKAPQDIAASIRQKLYNKAKEINRPFHEVLQYFCMERFLYRLSRSAYKDRFIVKGALMLSTWVAVESRPTMDIDFLGRIDNSVEGIESVIREICGLEAEPDGVTFDLSSIRGGRIKEDADYEGVRTRFAAFLGNARVVIQIDIGFGDIIVPGPVEMEYPVILNLPRPHLKGYTRESTIAEKFQAMVALGIVNSRMKDFFDIWLLSRQFDFDGKTLADALKKTFEHRGTAIQDEPVALTEAFSMDSSKQIQWRAFIRKGRFENVPHELGEVVSQIASFLAPVSRALLTGGAFDKKWKAPGPWA